ncbi:putative peptide zinc metalloprotease protein [Variovorax sp. TBS-050B]|uniref:HlyD family efflux transporter periplasmic adaptor subunit n=1 Tax=Variovorax sp. TBS-050B TaxID=2940551 RepID=UPI002474E55D|nr:HlyD family efflux transporter periplasmic adaptor subunit [Variovorax sp. TBS-050B]MDH6593097.1 putative peptide zinc metalloprotease protein [Variovorax sp. TBS-050B]
MPHAINRSQRLPPLRQDLRLIEGGAHGSASDGTAQWRIHDPLAQRFYSVGSDVVDMLAHWGEGSAGALRAAMLRERGRAASDEKIAALCEFLQRNELLRPVPQQTFARVRRQVGAARRSPGSRVLHGYLFFKLPLARPDAFLRRTLAWVQVFFAPALWWTAALLGLVGLYLVSRQWERFVATFPDMLSAGGIATFGLSLVLVKALHELGHGYAAVHMGARVTTMGMAFVVMAPILYTDTTDAWRLPHRRQRVLIDAAGMLVELLVAVAATLAWVFLPDGPMRHAAFALATTGWVLSLAVNLNPLMRFDGYYLFSDLLGQPNLQERAFAMGRWWLRELLFGFGDAAPEPARGRRRLLLVGFAYATWLYRFFLFLGIALLVYHYFFKMLGIFLFAVELGWFIARPVWRELRIWAVRRREAGPRGRITALLLLGLLVALLLPFPYTVRIPAMLTAARKAAVFSPRAGRIEAVHVRPREQVRAGQVLIDMAAPEIEQRLHSARANLALLRERLARRGVDESDLSASMVLAHELGLEHERIEGLERERDRLQVRAPMDGVIAELAEELGPGHWIGEGTQLALIAAPGGLSARGYVAAHDLRRIAEGDEGRFVDELRMQPARALRLERVATAASEHMDHWLLASTHGGPVAARAQGGRTVPEHAVFEVTALAAAAGPAHLSMTELRGELRIRGRPESLGARMFRRVAHVLVREAGA